MKYFALSDIHGRKISLEDFIQKGFETMNPQHHIVLLGDYFDRYPENMEVLSFLEALLQDYPERVHLLYGNHDAFIDEFVSYALKNSRDKLAVAPGLMPRWLLNGGAVTLIQLFGSAFDRSVAYTEDLKHKLKRVQAVLKHLKPYYESDQYIFTHASINRDRIIDYWDRKLVLKANPTSKKIVIGHSTFLDLLPQEYLMMKKNLYLISFIE